MHDRDFEFSARIPFVVYSNNMVTIGGDLSFNYESLNPEIIYSYCSRISWKPLEFDREVYWLWPQSLIVSAYWFDQMITGRRDQAAFRYAGQRWLGKSAEYATKYADIYEKAYYEEEVADPRWSPPYRGVYALRKAYAMTEWSKPEAYGKEYALGYLEGRYQKDMNHQEALEYAKQQADKAQ